MVYPIPHVLLRGPPSAVVRTFPDRDQSWIAKTYETEDLTDKYQWVSGSLYRVFPSTEIPVLREIWHRPVVSAVVEGGHQGGGEEVQSKRMKGTVSKRAPLGGLSLVHRWQRVILIFVGQNAFWCFELWVFD